MRPHIHTGRDPSPAVKDLRARHFNTSQFQFQGFFFLRIPDKLTNPSQPNACRTSPKIYAVPGEHLATSFPPPNLPVPSSTLQSLPLLLHLDGRWGCPIPVPAEPEVIDASHEFVQCAKAPGSQNEPLKDIDSMCSGCLMILLDLAWPAWNQKSIAPRKITHPRESQRPSYSTCSSDSCLTWAMQRDNVTESASGLPSSELGSIHSQKIPKKSMDVKFWLHHQ